MKKLLLAGLLLMGSTTFAAHVSIGVNFGAPPPPPRVAYFAAPGPGYVWIDGFYYPARRGWEWRPGYWSRARMWARIGSDRDMRAAAITEVIGNEVAATRTATLTAAS